MKRILLVDTLNSSFILLHQNERNIPNRFITELRRIILDAKIDKIILCCDQGNSTYRNKLYPDYKKTRKTRREQATPEDKAKLERFFEQVKILTNEVAPMFGIEVLGTWGVEADDIIAYLVNHIDLEQNQILIASSDSDLMQLLRLNVVQRGFISSYKFGGQTLSPKVWVNRKRYLDTIGIEPRLSAVAKSLCGDTSDNIRGITGLGEVNAIRAVQAFGGIDEIYQNLDKLAAIPRFPKKAIQEMEVAYCKVMRNFQLINLNHSEDVIADIYPVKLLEDMNSVIKRLGEENLLAIDSIEDYYFSQGAINRLENLETWLMPFQGIHL